MIVSPRLIIILIMALFLSACSAVIPSNYLSADAVARPIKIDGKWKDQPIITISAQTLNTPMGNELLAPAMRPQPYRVGQFDNLNIIVWGHPEISTVATSAIVPIVSTAPPALSSGSNSPISVQTDGTIFYPYVGVIYVDGLTLNQIQRKIAFKLDKKLIVTSLRNVLTSQFIQRL